MFNVVFVFLKEVYSVWSVVVMVLHRLSGQKRFESIKAPFGWCLKTQRCLGCLFVCLKLFDGRLGRNRASRFEG